MKNRMNQVLPRLLATLVTAFASFPGAAQGTVFVDEIRGISELAELAQSEEFEITQAGSYEVVLTDLGAQLSPAAPMDAVQFGLTRGTSLAVARESAAPLAAAPYTLSTTATLSAGRYVVRVAGKPGANAGSGTFQVAVRPTGLTTNTFTFAGALTAKPAAIASQVALVETTTPALPAGNYFFEAVDFAFPAALVSAGVFVGPPGGGGAAIALTPPALTAVSDVFPASGPLRVFARADSGLSANGALMRVRIRDSSTNAVVFTLSIPVGRVTRLGAPSAAVAAGPATLSVADTGFPAALQSFGVLLAGRVNELARTSVAGSTSVTVVEAGPHEVFGFGAVAAASGGGSLAVELRSGSTTPLSEVLAALEPNSGRFLQGYPVTIATAGTHTAQLTDLQLPAALTAAGVAIVQGGTVVQRRDSPGTLTASLTPGPAQVLVRAATVAPSGNLLAQVAGLLGVSLVPPSGARLLDTTLGVGSLFAQRRFTVAATSDLRIAVDDVRFPRPFADLAAAVTRGSERVGLIFGGGSFDVLQAPAGEYVINFIGIPDAALRAGTYRVAASVKPPNPTITLTASPAEPAIGATTVVTWSAQGATSCTASGAWTGTKATSGTETTSALNTPATFTLGCTGLGGTASQSLTVTPRAATGSGGSGGSGGIDLLTLLVLGGLLAAGIRARLPVA
jgi:hypothetical protein